MRTIRVRHWVGVCVSRCLGFRFEKRRTVRRDTASGQRIRAVPGLVQLEHRESPTSLSWNQGWDPSVAFWAGLADQATPLHRTTVPGQLAVVPAAQSRTAALPANHGGGGGGHPDPSRKAFDAPSPLRDARQGADNSAAPNWRGLGSAEEWFADLFGNDHVHSSSGGQGSNGGRGAPTDAGGANHGGGGDAVSGGSQEGRSGPRGDTGPAPDMSARAASNPPVGRAAPRLLAPSGPGGGFGTDNPVANNDSYSVFHDRTLTVAAAGVLANDNDGGNSNPLTAVLNNTTSHGGLSLNSNGSFTYTPSFHFVGTDSFTYHANDGSANSNVATVTISVTETAPSATNDSYSVVHNHALTVAAAGVLTNDHDTEGDALTATLVSSVTHGSLTFNSNGSFTYTPTAQYTGSDSFTYKDSDGLLTGNTATVTLTVTDAAPVANNDSYSLLHDHALTLAAPGVLVNDTDADGDALSTVLISGPTHGTLTLNANGSFTYTPTAHYAGSDTFTYKASDGILAGNTATVTLNVTDGAPVSVNDLYGVLHDTTLTIPVGVLQNDSDPDNDPLTATLVSTVSHGTLNLQSDGSFVYTPATHFLGTDSFTYKAYDGAVYGNIATASISVSNQTPVSFDDAYNVVHDRTLTKAAPGILANDHDDDGDALTAILVSSVSHGSLTFNADGSFSYTPALHYTGTDSFTYQANDGVSSGNVATVTFTVTDQAPSIVDGAASVVHDRTLAVAAPGVLTGASDADHDVLTVSLVHTVSHGTLTLHPDGSFNYVPNVHYTGSDSFTFQASDGVLSSNVATYSLTVTDQAPVPTNDSYTVTTNSPLEQLLPGVRANDTDPDGDVLTVQLMHGTTHGNLTFNPDGSFLYVPAQNYLGMDSFTYQASDGILTSALATVSLSVVPEAPRAVADHYALLPNTTLDMPAAGVLANDRDPQGVPLQAILSSGPVHGTLVLHGDGSFRYTPNAGYIGSDSFSYQASNGTTSSSPTTVALTIGSDAVTWAPCCMGGGLLVANQYGGSGSGQGSVTTDGKQYTLHEGNSLLVTLSQTFTVPSSPGWLAFSYTQLNFDGSDTRSINDAFEAALVDGNSHTLVYPFSSQRDAFFNVTAGQTAKLGQGVTFMDRTVAGGTALADQIVFVDISYLTPGSSATVLFRLVNDNHDTNSSVQIGCHEPILSGAASVNEAAPYTLHLATRGPAADRTHSWTIHWGDGTPDTVTTDPAASTALHTYADGPNQYTITATVTNDDGTFASNSLPVTVTNVPPTVTIQGPASSPEGQVYTLNLSSVDNTQSAVDDDRPTSWTVNWGDGTTDTIQGNPSTAAHTYVDGPNNFTISAAATNDDGMFASNMLPVTVLNVPPTVSISGAAASNEGAPYTLNLSYADALGAPDDDTPTGWYVNWGDGWASTLSGSATTATHVFADGPSHYAINAVASNEDGDFFTNTVGVDVANVAPTVTPAANDRAPVSAPFTMDAATFTDPGFTDPTAGTQETFTASIDWGDGTTPTPGTVSVVEGSPGVLTSGTVSGTHTYAAAGTYTVTVTVSDDDGGSGAASFTMTADASSPVTKFYVVDQSAHATFRYDVDGNPINRSDLSNSRPRGIASDAAGDTQWVVDADHHVFVYNPDGSLRGSWLADGTNQPQDITTDGTDIWIVDDATDLVYHYANAATVLSGTLEPTDSFALDAADIKPSGLVTDSAHLWVTDWHSNEGTVFVYSLAGALLGSWGLDPADDTPSGITLNPNGGTDLWVVDRHTATVYRYADALGLRSGSATAAASFALMAGDHHPEGIADPPPVLTLADSNGAAPVPAGTTYLVTGLVQAGSSPVQQVTANGKPVQALDAAGHFFSAVGVAPGQNHLPVTATDTAGLSTSASVSITGTQPPPGAIDFSLLSDVTGSMTAHYGRTSYNEDTQVLYAELSVANTGAFGVDTALVVAVAHLSAPSVRVEHPTGQTPDGLPYYDYSALVGGKTLAAGATTQNGTLAFFDPERVPFTYDLVVLAHLNHAPAFTSVPVVQVVPSKPYLYTATGRDPETDPLTFALVTGPAGMAVDPATGAVTWSPAAGAAGTYPVALSLSDGRGGSAEQDFVISVSTPPNRPPVFTSTPIVDANVATPYVYPATAMDPDSDPLTFSVLAGPSGLSIDASTGQVTWTPTDAQLGTQHVTLQVTDGRGGYATQTFDILVQQQPGNHPPIIVSTPATQDNVPGPSNPASGNVSPTAIDLTLPANTTTTQTVSLTLPGNAGGVSDTGLWHVGDLFASTNNSTDSSVRQFAVSSGNLLHRFIFGGSGTIPLLSGIGFDNAANLYVTDFDSNLVDGLGANGLYLPTFGTNIGDPVAVVRAANGNLYISSWGELASEGDVPNPGGIFIYDAHLGSLGKMIDGTRVDWMDLMPNQTTMLYTDQGPDIMSVNIVTGVPGPNFSTGTFNTATGIRILPDGTVLVADYLGGVIKRLNASGQVMQTYTAPNDNRWFALALTPDGTSFWAGDHDRGDIVRFDIATGHILQTIPTIAGGGTLDGLAVYGALSQVIPVTLRATDPSVHFVNQTGTLTGLAGGAPLSFNFQLTSDGAPHSFDVQFVRADTGAVLGSIPVTLRAGDYLYPVKAIDPDGDPITYSMPVGPAGASLDPQTGRLTWHATTPGDYAFTVAASDGRGGRDTQSFILHVTTGRINHAPSFTSPPPATQAMQSQPYAYQATATDPDGDPLTYALLTPLPHVALDPVTGLLTWTPTGDQVGNQTLTVQVQDGQGGFANLSWTVTVAAPAFGNQPPQFTSTPVLNATVGQHYLYQAIATDPDGDPLTFDVPVSPAGLTIDAGFGTLAWTPTADQVGSQTVLLRVQDGHGNVALQPYQIAVTAAYQPPVFTSTPPLQAVVNLPYQYRAKAQDPLHLTLVYAVDTASAAAGVAINAQTGVLNWTATQTGTQHIVITASDGQGSATQAYDLTVVASAINHPPQFLSQAPTTLQLGLEYVYPVQAIDVDADPITYSLPQAPAGMTIDANGLITWPNAPAGQYAVDVRLDDNRGGVVDQTYTLTVAVTAGNHPPVITSTPPTVATAGHLFSYNLAGYDPDNDPVQWSLVTQPGGMTIDPSSGTLRWVPQLSQLGAQQVVAQLLDIWGAAVTQRFTVTVRGSDLPPEILSLPPTIVSAGAVYTYAVRAIDPENDPLTYSLPQNPDPQHMSISSTGVLTYQAPSQIPAQQPLVIIQVDDGQGGLAAQIFTLVVAHPTNHPPVITSPPVLRVAAGAPYLYAVTASDPEGDPVTFAVTTDAPGMTIDATTGVLTWTAPIPAGSYQFYSVTVTATDPYGAQAIQRFDLLDRVNHPPVYLTQAPTTVTAGQIYRYVPLVDDPDGDPLVYTLDAGAPAGMTVDDLGRIAWPTSVADLGTHTATVTATDPFGASVSQTFTLNVQADTQAPQVALQFSVNPAYVNSEVIILVAASDNVGVQSLTLTVNGIPQAIDSKGFVTYPTPQVGQFPVVVTASDAAGNTTTQTATLTVADPTVTGAPTVALTAPAGGAAITAPVDIVGTASDPNLLSWTVTAAALDGGASRIMAQGTSSETNAVLGQFDPTMLADGSYTLTLSAINAGGHTAKTSVQVTVAGKLKLGNFSFSVTDLSIPVAGIPITVSRTYDTLNAATSKDFGYGWSLNYRDVQLDVSFPTPAFDDYSNYPAFQDGTRVYVTLPGGQREGFTFTPIPAMFLGAVFYYVPNFVPDPGVFDQLQVPQVQLTKLGDEYLTIEDFGLNDYNPADPEYGGSYSIKTVDRKTYSIDAKAGTLQSVTDRNGNTLSFDDGGIYSTTGRAVLFQRDPQGRIIAITDPRGNSLAYSYDGNGNLATVTDRLGDVTAQYGYSSTQPHYVTTVTDALGIHSTQVTYGNDSRMSQLTDADGNNLSLAYNVTAGKEIITDPQAGTAGATATIGYDTQGNVANTTDATGAQSSVSYTNNLPTSTTQVERLPDGTTKTFTSTATYDPQGRPLTNTDATGATTQVTYDDQGNVLTSSDALGNTTHFGYDDQGHLIGEQSPTGMISRFGYDSHGNLIASMQSGALTQFAYDQYGDISSTTDASGVTTFSSYDANGNGTGKQQAWVNPSNASDIRNVIRSEIFNAADQHTQSTDEFGHSTVMDYDVMGRLIHKTDVLGNVSSTIYDSRNDAIQSTNADGTITRSVYDAEGRVIYQDDAHLDGQQTILGTQTIYDLNGRVVGTERLSNLQIEISTVNGVSNSNVISTGSLLSTASTIYNDLGQVVSSTDAANQTTYFRYDAAGRQIAAIDPLTHEADSAYDSAGHLSSTTDTLGHVTHYFYDAGGNIVRTIYADGSSTQASYDSSGRQSSSTDQMGWTTNYQYDARGRVTEVISPLVFDPETTQTVQPTPQYGYDAYGDMASAQDAKGRITSFTFDQFGHEVTHTLPNGQTESTSYDAFGRLLSSTDFDGQVTRYQYDSLGRVDMKTFYAQGSSTPGETVSYHFDPLGRQDRVTDTTSSSTRIVTYGFDADNRITSISSPEGTINYEYDPATGQHTRSYTANSDIRYGYDHLGRLEAATVDEQNGVILTTPLVTTYFYTPVGNVDHIAYPNGTETDYGYDSLNRLTSVLNKLGSAPLSSYTYTLEADGLRTGVTEQELEADGTTSTITKVWSYDALQRLTQEQVTSTILTNSYTDTYSFDLVGNRLTQMHTQGGQTQLIAYQYNANDELTAATSTGSIAYVTSYGYDANGSLTSVGRTGAGAETATYTYDLRNLLAGATITASTTSTLVSYAYDSDGIRVLTDVVVNGVETKTHLLIDPDNPSGYSQIVEENAGSTIPSMSYGLGLTVISQITGSGVVSYLLPDAQGSTRLLANSSGHITARYAYDANGNLLGSNSGSATRFLYTGQQFDFTLQQFYLRARYYNAVVGRFNARDPLRGSLSQPLSEQPYIYAQDNPVNGFDPSGKEDLGESLVTNAINGFMRAMNAVATLAVRAFSVARLVVSNLLSSLRSLLNPLRGIGRFFWDSRAFPTISRQYWLRNGPAAGRSLHHWLIPQRGFFGWQFPRGITNAGFNLLELPKILPGPLGLNQWMGLALRWGGIRAVAGMIVENGIRVLIPVTANAVYHAGRWLGNEIATKALGLDDGATATPIALNQEQSLAMQDDAANALIEDLDEEGA
jgi:RHS repeat-associated protein